MITQHSASPPESAPESPPEHDISAERTEQLLLAELRRLERLQTEFLYGVSHELRTPLTSIKGLLKLLLCGDLGPLTPLQQECLAVADSDSDRLARLISDLIDLPRLEARSLDLQPVTLDPSELLLEVAGQWTGKARRRGVALRIALPAALPPILADRERLAQALGALLDNAVEFTPSGGAVEIAAAGEESLLIVRVSDTGIGIPAHLVDRVFERFFQVEPDSGRGGLGLGLALAKQIVELHGGRVFAASMPGRGSTFTFTLPVCLG